MSWASSEGLPFPQGVTWVEDEQAYNFALYSKHAESVTLLLLDPCDTLRERYTFDAGPAHHARCPL